MRNIDVPKCFAVWIVPCAMLINAAAAAEGRHLNLGEAVELALSQGPTMAVMRAGVSIAEAELTAASRQSYPVISLEASVLRGRGEATSFFAVRNIATPDTPTTFAEGDYGSGTLALFWPLIDKGSFLGFGSPSVDIATAKESRAHGEHDVQAAGISNRVAKAYFDAIEATLETQLQQEIFDKRTRQLAIVKRKVVAQVISASEQAALASSLASTAADLLTAQNKEKVQVAQLRSLLGLQPGEPLLLEPPPTAVPELPPVEQIIEQALAIHPQMKAQQADVDISRGRVREARNVGWPTVAFVTAATYADALEGGETREFHFAGVNVSMTLSTFGKTAATVDAQSFGLLESERKLAVLRDSIGTDIFSAYFDVLNANARVRAAEQELKKAEYDEESARSKHEKLLVSLDQMISFENDTLSARVDLSKSRFSALSAYADLFAKAGKTYSVAGFGDAL